MNAGSAIASTWNGVPLVFVPERTVFLGKRLVAEPVIGPPLREMHDAVRITDIHEAQHSVTKLVTESPTEDVLIGTSFNYHDWISTPTSRGKFKGLSTDMIIREFPSQRYGTPGHALAQLYSPVSHLYQAGKWNSAPGNCWLPWR